MSNRNKSSGHLTKAYRQIGIKAVSAAVESNKPGKASNRMEAEVGQTKQGESSMNEQSTRFAERTTRATGENLSAGARVTEEATRNAEQSYSSALVGMRELNVKLIEMAHNNTEAVFELAYDIATAQAPSDLAEILAEHARRQFELITNQSKQLTELGQKLAGQTTRPFARTVNEAFARGT
jgi:hypothetical protein